MSTPKIGTIQGGDGGLSTIQDLYNLINGQTTSTAGSTQTTQEGLSTAGMQAMLTNALSSNSGLAAVSSGQRAAGGYGSATNSMLTNDLLTRTAAQIAAGNKTTTVVKSPTSETKGGITAGGAGNVAGTIGILQGLNTLTGGKSGSGIVDSTFSGVKKALGIGSDAATTPTGASGSQVAVSTDGDGIANGSSVGYNAASDSPVIGNSYDFEPPSTPAIDTSSIISPTSTDPTADAAATPAPTDSSTAPSAPASTDSTPVDNSNDFEAPIITAADGGLIKKGWSGKAPVGSRGNPVRLADGGSVSKKSLSILGTDQFSSAPDPAQSLAGGVSSTVNSQAAQNPTAQTNTNNSTGASSGGGVSGVSGSDASTGFTSAGNDIATASQGLELIGLITGNPLAKQMGEAGSIVSQPTLTGAAYAAANIASGGALSKVANIGDFLGIGANATGPGLASGVNAAADLNPIGAVTNSVLNMVGAPSLGSQVSTTVANNMSGDPLDNMLSVNNNYGTSAPTVAPAPTGSVAANSVDTSSVSVGAGTQDAGTPTSSDNTGSVGGGSTSAANGGEVEGPGSSVSDSIHAQLSDGEYVLPADIVKMLGVDNLDKMLQDHHVPAAVQKLQSFGK